MHQPLIIEPAQPVTSCVIWLHGLGASKYDFQDVAQILAKTLVRTRFVLPQAPTRAVSINGGTVMPSWYDIISMANSRQVNQADIETSANYLIDLIEYQRQQGIASENMVLAGFSQGGAIVYHAALKLFNAKLAGVLGLSTYGPSLTAPLQLTPTRQQTKFMLMHGTQDNVVLPAWGKEVFHALENAGAAASWHEYPMQHQFCQQQLIDIQNWLQTLFQPIYA